MSASIRASFDPRRTVIRRSQELNRARGFARPVQRPLMEKMAGEIALSDDPGRTLRRWRSEMKITVKDLSRQMGVTPSVVSDYESGRRRSPGVHTIKRLLEALLGLDQKSGRPV